MNSLVHDADVSLWETANRNLLRYMGVGGSFTALVPERAEGSWLYDSSGRKVLDFTSGQVSSVLRNAPLVLVDALRDPAGRLDQERTTGVDGTSVSGRVDLGGVRVISKNNSR